MSRIGKLPVEIPGTVKVDLKGAEVAVKGPKGSLKIEVHPMVSVAVEDNQIVVNRKGDTPQDRSLHGLTRSLIFNLVEGVTNGFEKVLQIAGIGYKAQVQGKNLVLNLGYSHPIEFEIPEGIQIEVENQTVVKVRGIDKQQVGQVSAEIRAFRPVEPYKGKGVRYSDEVVRKKEGKTAS